MRKLLRKAIAILIVIVMMSGLVSFNVGAASSTVGILSSSNVAQNQKLIQDAIDAAGFGNTVTVTSAGTITGTSTLTLTIPNGVTVDWRADYEGQASPLIDLLGVGSFIVETGGRVENKSASSYSAIRANAPAVPGPGGITITVTNGGTVKAGLGTAIEGAGEGTKVSVETGGTVSNSATNNLRPVINMTYDFSPAAPVTNVTVSGGEVFANVSGTTAYGYGIQTYGNVLVSGGKVYTHGGYGRAINIVGVSSNATVTGGEVFATSSGGVAISSATTAGVDVTNTSVVVSGGLVYANAGMAIRTTGRSSTITVSGGVVIAYGTGITGNNNVIFAQNNTAEGFKGVTGGIVVAWNAGAGVTNYGDGTETHITAIGATTADWGSILPLPAAGGISINGASALIFDVDLIGFIPVTIFSTAPPITQFTIKVTNIAPTFSNPTHLRGTGVIPELTDVFITVNQGDSVTINIAASATSFIYDVYYSADAANAPRTHVITEDTFTFTNVSQDMVLAVTYIRNYTGLSNITAYAGDGGDIYDLGTSTQNPRVVKVSSSPVLGSGALILPVSFDIEARPGYFISDVRVDTDSVLDQLDQEIPHASGNLQSGTYTFNTVRTGGSVITATFQEICRINVSHNAGGIVNLGLPDDNGVGVDVPNTMWAHQGDNMTFTIIPDSGYRIGSVSVNGNSRSSATFPYIELPNVLGNYSIVVTFEYLSSGGDGGEEEALPPRPQPGPNPEQGNGNNDVSGLLDTVRHIRYIQGVGENLFEPGRDMTRAEVAQMFFNLLLNQNVEITKIFPDEATGSWHERAVHTLASLGIIQGYPDGGFHPEDSITRAEFIAIATRFAKALPGITGELPFNDVPKNHWAHGYIYAAVQFGWIAGYGDESFQPNRQINRAEAVTIVNRMLNRSADRTFVDEHEDGLTHFEDVPQTHWAYYDIMEAFDAHEYDRDEDGVHEHWHEF